MIGRAFGITLAALFVLGSIYASATQPKQSTPTVILVNNSIGPSHPVFVAEDVAEMTVNGNAYRAAGRSQSAFVAMHVGSHSHVPKRIQVSRGSGGCMTTSQTYETADLMRKSEWLLIPVPLDSNGPQGVSIRDADTWEVFLSPVQIDSLPRTKFGGQP